MTLTRDSRVARSIYEHVTGGGSWVSRNTVVISCARPRNDFAG